jgi:hypothetical protein
MLIRIVKIRIRKSPGFGSRMIESLLMVQGLLVLIPLIGV